MSDHFHRIDKDLWIEWLSMGETQAALVEGPNDQVFVVMRKSFFDRLYPGINFKGVSNEKSKNHND